MTYDKHIAALAAEHQIVVIEKRGTRGMSWGCERRIRITPVAGPVSYATALHEIGHVVAPNGHGRKYSRLDKEAAAWRWAREHAIEWTERMDAEMQRSLGCYLTRARRHHWPIPLHLYQLVEG